MALIKDIYSPTFYKKLANTLTKVLPSFSADKFMLKIFSDDFGKMEWKVRMIHTARVLHEFMPTDFSEAAVKLEDIIQQLKTAHQQDTLAFIFLAEYISLYGLENFEAAKRALVVVTQFISCEFAVRPFLLKYPDQMLAEMLKWSLHENPSVRRLASEGSRPRLPWGAGVPSLKVNPKPILPILENLKNDPSESVRRSVANNLNDISKDHPDLVIQLAERWKGNTKETDAILKHGLRTLLKQGHADVLKQYGLESGNVAVKDFKVLTPVVKIGDSLEFSFTLINENPTAHTVRLEYGIYYKKSKGHLARKVFKISEKVYPPNATVSINRKQSFRLITTKVFYEGGHQISIIVNGEEKELSTFDLAL